MLSARCWQEYEQTLKSLRVFSWRLRCSARLYVFPHCEQLLRRGILKLSLQKSHDEAEVGRIRDTFCNSTMQQPWQSSVQHRGRFKMSSTSKHECGDLPRAAAADQPTTMVRMWG
jgi:hypothetical protein